MQGKLHRLQEDYEELTNRHLQLEQLNTVWAEKNIKLTEHIDILQVSRVYCTIVALEFIRHGIFGCVSYFYDNHFFDCLMVCELEGRFKNVIGYQAT